MAEYIERTEEIVLAMNAGARAIENTKRYHGAIYSIDVFSRRERGIPYSRAAEVLRAASLSSAADVAPVVHGRYVHDGPRFHGGVDWWHCSNCMAVASGVDIAHNYCPNCGAKMDGGEDDA